MVLALLVITVRNYWIVKAWLPLKPKYNMSEPFTLQTQLKIEIFFMTVCNISDIRSLLSEFCEMLGSIA